MNLIGSIIVLIVVLIISIFILVFPLHLAAKAMNAERNGAGWCLLGLFGASFMQLLGTAVPVFGNIVAFLLSSVAFAGILGTTFLRGMGIAILHVMFSALLILVAVILFAGVGFLFLG